jgi:hypothetical protein
VIVANAGDEVADITVTLGATTVQAASVPPGALQTIYLPWVAALKGPDGDGCGSAPPMTATVRENAGAYHVVASHPVSVYQFNPLEYAPQGGPPGKVWSNCPPPPDCGIGCFAYTADASLLLPTTSLGAIYRVTGYPGWQVAGIGPYVGVTGTKDGTNVTVELGAAASVAAGAGIPAAGPSGTVTFPLNAGDVVELVGTATSDLSGSLIEATAPIQVLAGIQCTTVPSDVSACDHLEESVLPVESLGKDYVVPITTSPSGKLVGHVVRLYGHVNGTHLSYVPAAPPGAPATLEAGQVVDLGVVSQNFEVTADHAFAVATFQLGSVLVDPVRPPALSKGDPAQTLVIPVAQYRPDFVFAAPVDYAVSYAEIVAPTSATVTLDGTVLPPGDPIGPSFGVIRAPLSNVNGGAHALSASAPVGVQVIGYGNFTSYEYPAGLNLLPIAGN